MRKAIRDILPVDFLMDPIAGKLDENAKSILTPVFAEFTIGHSDETPGGCDYSLSGVNGTVCLVPVAHRPRVMVV